LLIAWHDLERVRGFGTKTLISQTVRLGRASRLGEFICPSGAASERSGRSTPLLVLHTLSGMPRASPAAEAKSPLDCARDPLRHPSRVPALQASASEIPNFDSRLLSLVNSPIPLVGRRR